jgi:hypothetical protein
LVHQAAGWGCVAVLTVFSEVLNIGPPYKLRIVTVLVLLLPPLLPPLLLPLLLLPIAACRV